MIDKLKEEAAKAAREILGCSPDCECALKAPIETAIVAVAEQHAAETLAGHDNDHHWPHCIDNMNAQLDAKFAQQRRAIEAEQHASALSARVAELEASHQKWERAAHDAAEEIERLKVDARMWGDRWQEEKAHRKEAERQRDERPSSWGPVNRAQNELSDLQAVCREVAGELRKVEPALWPWIAALAAKLEAAAGGGEVETRAVTMTTVSGKDLRVTCSSGSDNPPQAGQPEPSRGDGGGKAEQPITASAPATVDQLLPGVPPPETFRQVSARVNRWLDGQRASAPQEPCRHPMSRIGRLGGTEYLWCCDCGALATRRGGLVDPIVAGERPGLSAWLRPDRDCPKPHAPAPEAKEPAAAQGEEKCDGHGCDEVDTLTQERDEARQEANRVTGENWAIGAQLSTAREAIGADRLEASDGYLDHAIRELVAEAERLRAELDEANRINETVDTDRIREMENLHASDLTLRREAEQLRNERNVQWDKRKAAERAAHTLRDLIVSLEEVHLRADVLEKKIGSWSHRCRDLNCSICDENASAQNELDMLAARRVHLLKLMQVHERVEAARGRV
jgi:hypothetical protein